MRADEKIVVPGKHPVGTVDKRVLKGFPDDRRLEVVRHHLLRHVTPQSVPCLRHHLFGGKRHITSHNHPFGRAMSRISRIMVRRVPVSRLIPRSD